jgi:hypothetical protein
VDTAKYQGTLTRLKIYPDPTADNSTEISRFLVYMTSVSATSGSGTDKLGSKQFPLLALLDSGTTWTYLPSDLTVQIWKEAGVALLQDPDTAETLGVIPCDFRNGQGSFSFGFGGPNGATIKVGMDELVLFPSSTVTFPSSSTYAGKKMCVFGIQPMGSVSTDIPFALLGDTFLRSAYVVYDLQNKELALGQTIFNSTQSNVVAFASASATVPSSTPAPSQDSAALSSQAVKTTPTSYAAAASFTAASAAGGLVTGREAVLSLAMMAMTMGAIVLL